MPEDRLDYAVGNAEAAITLIIALMRMLIQKQALGIEDVRALADAALRSVEVDQTALDQDQRYARETLELVLRESIRPGSQPR